MRTVKDLLKDWIASQESIMYEFSGDFKNDSIEIIHRAKQWAQELNIEWDDSMLSDGILRQLDDQED